MKKIMVFPEIAWLLSNCTTTKMVILAEDCHKAVNRAINDISSKGYYQTEEVHF
ncbi:MAG: hypothetical protein J6V33_05705 [Bacteroidales bacterium]|nr:hypothetical protein [Bacteroidales bacterium]